MMPLPQPSDFTAKSLPPNPFHLTAPVVHAAYNICLSLELRANLVVLPSEKHPSALLCVRVLGFTLIESPAQAINTDGSDHTLLALGKYYIQRLICLFKLVPSPDDALVRDGHHCLFNPNLYDATYAIENNATVTARNLRRQLSTLQCAHILTEGDDIESPSQWAASIWAPMYPPMNGHPLENMLTLSDTLRWFFDRLAIWLQPTDEPSTYTITSSEALLLEELPSRIITLTTLDPEALPPPNPAYLRIHAASCRIAHMSGAADYVEEVLREEKEIRVRVESMGHLAQDGSSADIITRNEYGLRPLVTLQKIEGAQTHYVQK
ncbi:hypothetical protein ARMGADRAFT_1164067 [Armillaria gallica]|uniref:HNH nuclease domain-containing protein n=1 Tax=Armillaria gallica TaxID=47427 RepID=A0A2H3DXD5_ARMGA|nr:hypothetical protein ARMGADRAFT_1164067 [Armillaria gallica]